MRDRGGHRRCVGGRQPSFHVSRSLKNPEIKVTAIARAFSRAFPANSVRAECLRQLLALGAAILFVSLMVASYGLDLSPGFSESQRSITPATTAAPIPPAGSCRSDGKRLFWASSLRMMCAALHQHSVRCVFRGGDFK
jgi:hypothetical protein